MKSVPVSDVHFQNPVLNKSHLDLSFDVPLHIDFVCHNVGDH